MTNSHNHLQIYDTKVAVRPRVNRFGRFYCRPDWSWDSLGRSVWEQHGLNLLQWNFDLWTVLQGCGELSTGGKKYELGMGTCFILRGDTACSARHDPADPLQTVCIHFDFLDAQNQIIIPDGKPVHQHLQNMKFFTHLLERIERSWSAHQELPNSESDLWLSACLAELTQQDRSPDIHGVQRQQATRIENICREIRRNPAEAWEVDELASQMNFSRAHFSRVFKQFTQCAPRDFITNARMEEAKNMLHASNYTIGQIAENLGYRDIYYFSRHFKQIAGCSPSAYRKTLKG